MLAILGDAEDGGVVAGVQMPEAREHLWWHERLMLRREYACEALARAKQAAKQYVEAGGVLTEGQVERLAWLEAQAAAARQSRRDYEADRRDVALAREPNAGNRGANGRRRAVCVDRVTGRQVSPKPFSGREQWAVVRARAEGDAEYRQVRDAAGVLLRTEAVLLADDGELTGFGALQELGNLAPARPDRPDARAVRLSARDAERAEARAELRADCERAERVAARVARGEGRRSRRGSRGGSRGRAARRARRAAEQ